MGTWRLYELDVWGNDEDGYDVNDVFRTGFTVDFEDDISDGDLITLLADEGLIKKTMTSRTHREDIEIDGDEFTIYFNYKGRPEFELRKEEDEEDEEAGEEFEESQEL